MTLAWDPSSGTDIAGYRLYEGVASRTYTNVIDAGIATNATLQPGERRHVFLRRYRV